MLFRLLPLLLCALEALADDYCFAEDTTPYNYFATKTMYELVRNKKIKIGEVPNCTPVLVWGLFRHGTRYPHVSEVRRQKDLSNLRDTILRNHNMQPHNGQLCFEDLELLRDWTYTVNESDADLLSSTGVNEMYLLAKRLRTDFPLLNIPYSEDKFKIRFSTVPRTKQSAQAFAKGLFEGDIELSDSLIDDTLLEVSRNCSSWKSSTNSEGAKEQTKAFRTGVLMKELISSVSRRLGFSYDLSFDVIDDMFNMCRYDKAWRPKMPSPWCAAFTKEHLKLMEYDEDLDYYYRSGYGNPFTTMLGCPLVKDLIETFNNRTLMSNSTDETGPFTVLNFAHSLTLRSVLIRLGMASDQDPITADNYNTQEKRQWRTSVITPFAGNLVTVLYKCNDTFKVMFYLNEHHIDYRGCQVGLCDWSYIYERFGPIVKSPNCNLDFCMNASSAVSKFSTLIIPVIVFLNLYVNIL